MNCYADLTDEQLIVLAQSERDPMALAHLRIKYQSKLASIAFRILQDSHRAEDIVSGVFASLWHCDPPSRRFKPGASSFWTHASVCTRRDAIDAWRASKRQVKTVSLDCLEFEANPPTCPPLFPTHFALGAVVSRLKPRDRKALVVYARGDSLQEASRSVGMSDSNLKKVMQRVRAKLIGGVA